LSEPIKINILDVKASEIAIGKAKIEDTTDAINIKEKIRAIVTSNVNFKNEI
jgi:hypothetical protein